MSDGDQPGLALLREVLADGPPAWLVGGALRERLRGRPTDDLDVAVGDGDAARDGARALARAGAGHAFPLSDAYGAWRAVGPALDGAPAWQIDLTPLQGADLAADLAARDLTVNAIAEPVAGGPLIDPFDGAGDLAAGRLRMVGPASFAADPVRVLRLARFAAELGATVDPATMAAARAAAPALAERPGERLLPELERVLLAGDWARGVAVADESGALAALLPAATGAEGRLRPAVAALLEALLSGAATVPEAAADDRRALAARAGDRERRIALGLAALVQRAPDPGRALDPLRPSQRLRTAVTRIASGPATLSAGRLAELARPPRLGEGPPPPETPDVARDRAAYRALRPLADAAPEAVLVARTVVGAAADERPWATLLERALRWAAAPPRPPIRGDRLAQRLGIAPGPGLGALLHELTVAADAGRLAGEEQAVALARRWLGPATGDG
ncbi:hypothetical protein [Patulibacter defluvii]|uniref:hypothetical protein n=1 Tax=Patulibacter defluvii TaxID=3095358 RepID=UPI002A754317|nr:hypothetical protein [Patulibacter sp. DM4]